MRLRPARPADFPALARIVATAYRESFGSILSSAALALREPAHFERRFAAEPVPPVLAEHDDGTPLGFHLVRESELRMLFVDAAARSRGAGAALLADAEARGAVRLESFRDNEAARTFYGKRGWRLAREYEREFAGEIYAFVEYVKESP